MELFISHNSALSLWRSSEDGIPRAASSRTALPADNLPNFATLSLTDLRNPEDSHDEVDLLVSSATDRRMKHGIRWHVWSAPVPTRSFSRIASGVHVSSPEFVFLQMAASLSLISLIMIGFELCGTYALDSHEKRGFKTRGKPLTTKMRIISYLDTCKGVKHLRKAKRAAHYIIDGSASPMETALAMILCLPIRLGGYGFPQAAMNHEMLLTFEGAVKGSRKRTCRCDMLWSKQAVALEYDSDTDHLSSRKFSDDSARRNDLIAAGITVLTVTKHQVINRAYWPTLADNVSAALHVKPRIRTENHPAMQRQLYADLFGMLFNENHL